MSDVIRLVIADDHVMFCEGLRWLLESQPGFCVVGQAFNGSEAIERVRETQPDVLLLDLGMPRLSGLDVIAELRRMRSTVRTILLVASIDRADTIRALQLGAWGVLLKEAASELLFRAVESVVAGQYWIGNDTVSDLVRDRKSVV